MFFHRRVFFAAALFALPLFAAAAEPTPEGVVADELRAKALAGDADAQLLLADEYLFGKKRPGNPVLAAYWYRKAAERGSAAAKYYLGCCYEHGWGVEK
ncbi:MAG: sel1 repeat family protein, partial [Lentisphaeria bacterium]|nr:sel1 repeat family protein [Lentisphaeria bacterium]